jgi:hypothetical protein
MAGEVAGVEDEDDCAETREEDEEVGQPVQRRAAPIQAHRPHETTGKQHSAMNMLFHKSLIRMKITSKTFLLFCGNFDCFVFMFLRASRMAALEQTRGK